MILTVCLNAAIDVTYQLADRLAVGSSHRVSRVSERAGGKAINVARVLTQLGESAQVLAFQGSATGMALSESLSVAKIPNVLVPASGATRRTVTVVDSSSASVFNEPGPVITDREWHDLIEVFDTLAPQSELVVLSGSLPPGVAPTAYQELSLRARTVGLPVIVDAQTDPLLLALVARPYLVKPNREELAATFGVSLATPAQTLAAARRLIELGAENVVVSCGAQGLLALTADGQEWGAVGPEVSGGNPTGAGDALVAALAAATLRGQPWPQRLAQAMAVAAGAVAVPVAGEFEVSVADEHAAQVRVQPAPHFNQLEWMSQ